MLTNRSLIPYSNVRLGLLQSELLPKAEGLAEDSGSGHDAFGIVAGSIESGSGS